MMEKQQDETQPVASHGVMSSDGLLYPDDLGRSLNARDLSRRCIELARRLVEQGTNTKQEIARLTAEVERHTRSQPVPVVWLPRNTHDQSDGFEDAKDAFKSALDAAGVAWEEE